MYIVLYLLFSFQVMHSRLIGLVTQVRSLSCASNPKLNGNDRKENDAQSPKHAWHEIATMYVGAVPVVVRTGRGGRAGGNVMVILGVCDLLSWAVSKARPTQNVPAWGLSTALFYNFRGKCTGRVFARKQV